jgi:hypothetical protein
MPTLSAKKSSNPKTTAPKKTSAKSNPGASAQGCAYCDRCQDTATARRHIAKGFSGS